MSSLVKRLLKTTVPGLRRSRATPDGPSNEHQALQDLYADADGSNGWRLSLLAFTASHLERHDLSGADRRALRVALNTDSAAALAAMERLHGLAHRDHNYDEDYPAPERRK